MNFESYEVNEKTFFTYEDAYEEYCNTNADVMWGLTIKGNWARIHCRRYNF